ncbi:MAG TPA: hypothetical protein VFM86_09730 [Pedococcus sp.]|nr:hypothetical protein [Pedococcus sp.]
MNFGGNYRNESWERVDPETGTTLIASVVVDDGRVTLTHEAFALLMERAGFTKKVKP